MGEDESAFFDLLFEFVVCLYSACHLLAVLEGLLIDIGLDFLKETLYVAGNAFEGSLALFERVAAHDLDGAFRSRQI